MLKRKIKFTYQDYLHMPEERRYELVEGELVMVPSPSEYHQRISGNLYAILRDFVRKNSLGAVYFAPLDVVLSNEDVLQPDIVFVSQGRSYVITPQNISGAPDLVVEILSPATAYRDREIKNKLYAQYGVGEYWIVDPDDRSVAVLKLGEEGFEAAGFYREGEILASPLLRGLSIPLTEIF